MAIGYYNNYVNLYDTRAHVFQINPETKNSWLPKGESAIPISFVAAMNQTNETQPTNKRELKIIGTNQDGDIVLEAVILQKTQFTKRSQKFGQWTDHTGMVYGLGFNSESELNEFVETFQDLQRNILSTNNPTVSPQSQPATVSAAAAAAAAPVGVASTQVDKVNANPAGGNANTWTKSQEHINNVSETVNSRDFNNSSSKSGDVSAHPGYSNTLAHPGHQQAQIRRQQAAQPSDYPNNNNNGLNNTSNNGINDNGGAGGGYPRTQSMYGLQTKSTSASSDGRATPETEGTTMSQSEWQMRANSLKQTMYENERLKQVLEESSKNASVWANELQNLRTNNVKLTQALQESKAHVEEWERELLSLRDENKELKLRVMALESANESEKGNEYKMDLQKYKDYVEDIQSELRKKDNEIEELQRSMEQMEIKAQEQNDKSDVANGDKSINHHQQQQQKQRLESINSKLDAKINELANVQREFAQLLEKFD